MGVHDPEVIERHRDIGPVGRGVRLGELAEDGERLLIRPARLGEAVLVGVQVPEIDEHLCDVGPVGRGVRLGELAVDGERLLQSLARLGEAVLVDVQAPEIIERHRKVGPVGRGVRLGESRKMASASSYARRASAKRCSSACRFPRLLSAIATSGR
jgi:hypothetical protein